MPTNKKKKKRPSQKKKQSAGVSELVQAADDALHTQDSLQAISLYTAAVAAARCRPLQEEEDEQQTVEQQDGKKQQLELSTILEKRAHAKLSIQDQQGAMEDFQAALQLLQQQNSTIQSSSVDEQERQAGLLFYIGQLSEGKDALEVYRQGIECLEESLTLRRKQREEEERRNQQSPSRTTEDAIMKDVNDNDKGVSTKDDPIQETQWQLAAAYCSVAELYLTDLCYEENAEQECESYIAQSLKATEADGGEPIVDALQTVASLRLSQKRGMEAVDFILRAFKKIKTGCEALSSLVGLREEAPNSNPEQQQASELLELDAVQSLPGFEFRCQTAKLLLECSAVLKENSKTEDPRHAQCLYAAIDVLGSLLAENDEVVEVWFLTGEAFAAMNPPNKELALHYWERTKEMLTSVEGSLEQEIAEATDEEEEDALQRHLDEVTCQLEDVTTKLDDLGLNNANEGSMEE